jgi:hypothetical protein
MSRLRLAYLASSLVVLAIMCAAAVHLYAAARVNDLETGAHII